MTFLIDVLINGEWIRLSYSPAEEHVPPDSKDLLYRFKDRLQDPSLHQYTASRTGQDVFIRGTSIDAYKYVQVD